MDFRAVRPKDTTIHRIAIRYDAHGQGARMKILRILRAMLREIFEESAYQRFCQREGVAPGQESYASFLRQTNSSEAKVRCC